MTDRVPTYPGRVLITPTNGDPAFTADITMADSPSVAGTPINKATLLKDATATLFGLTSAAVPDNVLAFLGQFNLYTWRRVNGSNVVSYVTSANRNAYPDSGTSGGYTYTYVGVPFENIQKPAIEAAMGSYVGDNTNGSTHPTVIDMGIEADLILVCGLRTGTNSSGFGIRGGNFAVGGTGLSTTWSGTEVSFYSSSSSQAQLNYNNQTYYWVALKFNI